MPKYIDFEMLKKKVSLLNVVQNYRNGHTLTLQESTGCYVGDCPFCGNNDESSSKFKVDPSLGTNGGFHCFGCSAKGNAIEYVAQLEDVKETEAARRIAEHFDVIDCDYKKPRRGKSVKQGVDDSTDGKVDDTNRELDALPSVTEDDNVEVPAGLSSAVDVTSIVQVLREQNLVLQTQLSVKDEQIDSLLEVLKQRTAA